MAYYHTRAAMSMVDVSLLYSGLTVKAELPLRNSSVSVWIESELDTPLTECEVTLKYIDSAGVGAAALLATERHTLSQPLPPAAGRRVSGPGVALGGFTPPASMAGKSVLLVRASLQCAEPGASASNDYTFAVVSALGGEQELPAFSEKAMLPTSSYRAFPGLIPADRTNFTASLQGHAVCEAQCNASAACVGYTTDQTATNCWLYDTVHALVSSPPDAFHLKPGLPVPPHAPPPPPPPPPLPPPLAPLANASAARLILRVESTSKDDGVIAFRLTNSGDRVALFARLALRETPSGPELPYVLFSDNYANLLPGQSINATAAITSTASRTEPLLVCAEAWNAPEKCARSERLSVKMDDDTGLRYSFWSYGPINGACMGWGMPAGAPSSWGTPSARRPVGTTRWGSSPRTPS